jgi:hypothetical protein
VCFKFTDSICEVHCTLIAKKAILDANKARFGGVIRSDQIGKPLGQPSQSQSGVPTDMNLAEVDHVKARANAESNSSGNTQVLSKRENIKKRDNYKMNLDYAQIVFATKYIIKKNQKLSLLPMTKWETGSFSGRKMTFMRMMPGLFL